MKSPGKVSVIMPAYNAAAFIQEAVNSILSQTYEDLELIIINDGSSDETETIIQAYTDPRIVYIKNDINKGIAASTNLGIRASTGMFIALMDADDISFTNRLEKQVAVMIAHPDTGICGGGCRLLHSGEEIIFPSGDEEIRVAFLHYYAFRNPTLMFRKTVFSLVQEWYREEYRYTLDYDLTERLMKHTRMFNIPSSLLYYRIHEQQTSTLKHSIIVSQSEHIKIRQLENNLSLSLTPDDIRYHLELLKMNTDVVTPSAIYRNIKWLSRLREANKRTGYYSPRAFEVLLKQMNIIYIGLHQKASFLPGCLRTVYLPAGGNWLPVTLTWKEHMRFIMKALV